jgi:hypothetical protein
MQQKIMLASMNSKEELSTSSIATRKAGGTMMASKSLDVVVIAKCEAMVTSMSMQTRIYDGRYNCYDETKKRQSRPHLVNNRYNI